MPIYEYQCNQCNNRFETLVRGSEAVECPSCHSTSLAKQLSVFAASVRTAFASAKSIPDTACSACGDPRGPGACALD